MVSENKSSNDKFIGISFRYGMIASILMILLTMLFFWISGAGSRPVIVWNHFILLIVMYYGVKRYRNNIEGGYISFKQCYLSGLLIGVIAALVFGAFMIIYTKYIDKDIIAFFIKQNEDKFRHYINGDLLKQQIDILIKYSTPFWMGIKALAEVFIISLFMPLLMGVFFRKEKIIKIENN